MLASLHNASEPPTIPTHDFQRCSVFHAFPPEFFYCSSAISLLTRHTRFLYSTADLCLSGVPPLLCPLVQYARLDQGMIYRYLGHSSVYQVVVIHQGSFDTNFGPESLLRYYLPFEHTSHYYNVSQSVVSDSLFTPLVLNFCAPFQV